MKYIPNFITCLNLTSGFFGIILAVQGHLLLASWLIVAAMIFDFLDGFSARMLKAYSELGKELDSLADVISFGIAPGIIMFHLLYDALSLSVPMDTDTLGTRTFLLLMIPALMPVCAALRLAKFNLDSTQTSIFKGMPTPANAIAVVTLVFTTNHTDFQALNSFIISPLSLAVFTIILSLLMITRLPLLSLKMSNFYLKGNEGRYIMIVLLLAFLLLFGLKSLPFIIPLYILSSLVQFYIIDRK